MDANKQIKPLTLKKETLRTLSDADMEGVNGGFTPILTITPETPEISVLVSIIAGDE